ncbi:PrsW family intramembrane metalloprotease [Patescibacteria group bacterium]|nr:PrsW family intramembrane metalloprotease [Patescibacteria group bacterium]
MSFDICVYSNHSTQKIFQSKTQKRACPHTKDFGVGACYLTKFLLKLHETQFIIYNLNMVYLLYLLGFAPSIVWLIFYLRKDAHPESNRMILKIFFYGMLSALAAIVLEKSFSFLIAKTFLKNQIFLYSVLTIFIGGALIEEYLKYIVIRFKVLKNSELDEAFDVFLYMIISALGFAALENILLLINYSTPALAEKVVWLMISRFVFATFLHGLCSGLLGIFLCFSFFHLKNKNVIFMAGLLLATLFHGFYNFSIIKIQSVENFVLPLIILAFAAFLVFLGMKKIKKLKSICVAR